MKTMWFYSWKTTFLTWLVCGVIWLVQQGTWVKAMRHSSLAPDRLPAGLTSTEVQMIQANASRYLINARGMKDGR